MGLVKVKGQIGRDAEHLQDVEFLVDTGSLYTFVPSAMAHQLGIAPTVRSRVVLADSRTAEVGLSAGYLRLDDREGGILIGIMDVPSPLLGATSLEILGLAVDPVRGVVEHSRPFGPAALGGGMDWHA